MNNRVLVPYREPQRVRPCVDALQAAGIEPLLVRAGSPISLHSCRGLLLTGGTDVNPALYGEAKQPETDTPDPELDATEMSAISAAVDRGLPILAICRGLQLLNVHHGGTLIQHLVPPERHRTIAGGDRSMPVHPVAIEDDTLLASIAGTAIWQVNSRHHQAVKTLGRALRVSARHPADGVIEAIERADSRFVLAVQWHPEDQLVRDRAQMELFHRFAEALNSSTGPNR